MSNSFNISVKPEIAAVEAKVDIVDTVVDSINSTGAGSIKYKCDFNTNRIADVKTVVDTINAKTYVQSLEFWSSPCQQTIKITDTPADKNFNNIVVIGVPGTATLLYVELLLNVPLFVNTYGNTINQFTASQKLRVKKSTGSWDTDDLDGINFSSGDVYLRLGQQSLGGQLFHGDADVKSEVDADGTYNVQLEDSKCTGDAIYLNSAQVGLRFFFTT